MARSLNKVLAIFFLLKIFANKLSLASEESNTKSHKLFFLQKSVKGDDNDVLLKVTWIEKEENLKGCQIYTGKNLINKVLRSSNNSMIRILPGAEMQNLLEDCKEFNLSGKKKCKREAQDHDAVSSNQTANSSYLGMPLFFPGTKWCGIGDTAEEYNDLGSDQNTDRCCRAHDQCKDYLPPGEAIGNLINTSWMPLLSCECDHDLYNCLTRVNSVTSTTLRNLYFNILNKHCFELDYPLTDQCKIYYTFLKINCWEYERNTTAPKVYHLVPAKKYKVIPVLGPLTIELPPTPP